MGDARSQTNFVAVIFSGSGGRAICLSISDTCDLISTDKSDGLQSIYVHMQHSKKKNAAAI
jgi:hypothetical protein